MITAFARLKDPELGDWIEREVRVPELAWSTGSRRSPPTTTAPRWPSEFGVEDGWPVVCEPFTQWVLEDDFGDGRPPFEDVGVQLVADVEPYELMKLRLLNASHQALCYLGYLAGYRYAHEVCQDPLFAAFLLGYMDRRGHARRCAPVPGRRPRRLQAPADRAVRQPRGARHPGPAVRRELRPDPEVAGAGDPRATSQPAARSSRSALVVAAGPATPRASTSRASRSRSSTGCATRWWSGRAPARGPAGVLSDRDLFGDLVDDERFVSGLPLALDSLHGKGARATLEALADREQPHERSPSTEPSAMRVAVLRSAGDIGVEQRPAPSPGRGEVLVRVGSVGVCGSDTHYYDHGRIGRFVVESPLVLGHEASGVIAAVGEGVDPSRDGPARLHRARRPRPHLPDVPQRPLQPLPRHAVLRHTPDRRRLRRAGGRARGVRPPGAGQHQRRRGGLAGAAVGRRCGPAARPG